MKTKPFAQTLLAWRRKHKLTRVEACRRFQIPYRTFQDWEAEIHTPSQFVQATILLSLRIVPDRTSAKSYRKRRAKK